MRKQLQKLALAGGVLLSLNASAQRYIDDVFTDEQIVIHQNVSYGVNIDFLTTQIDFANLTAEQQLELQELQTTAATGGEYPAAYFNPADATTGFKIKDLKMDIYEPNQDDDEVDNRPVILYIHTGSFLPPPINGAPTGRKEDLAAVEICTRYAKKGYVAIAIEYRLGWNPIGESVQVRRGTLLNAVYRAIQDTKEAVRFIREDIADTYQLDEWKIALHGQGSGGYISAAYVTLDKTEELFLEKFRPNPFDETVSYINQDVVGDFEGANGLLTLYQASNTETTVQASVNTGGALADESWLEAGDVPMIGLNCVRDDFAPFGNGTVVVPTTQEEVVNVDGPNVFIKKANDLGNNDIFLEIADGADDYTDKARTLYGTSYEGSLSSTITVAEGAEGLYPIVRPLRNYLQNESGPWDFWDPNGPLATTIVNEEFMITAHQASIASNPFMSEEFANQYIDTIQGYAAKRISCALGLPDNPCNHTINVEENEAITTSFTLYPNPTRNEVLVDAKGIISDITIFNLVGDIVRTATANGASFHRMDISDLKSGIYLVSTRVDGVVKTQRLVKQ